MTDYYTLPQTAKTYFHEKELNSRSMVNKLMQRLHDDYAGANAPPAYRADNLMSDRASNLQQGSHTLNQAEAESIYKQWRQVAMQGFEDWKTQAYHLFRDYNRPNQLAPKDKSQDEPYNVSAMRKRRDQDQSREHRKMPKTNDQKTHADWKSAADSQYDDWVKNVENLANKQFHNLNLQWDSSHGWKNKSEVDYPHSQIIDDRTNNLSFQDNMYNAVSRARMINDSADKELRHKLDLIDGGFHPGRNAHTESAETEGHTETENVEEKKRMEKTHMDRQRNTRETNHINEQQYELKKTDVRAKPPIESGQMRHAAREAEAYHERFHI